MRELAMIELRSSVEQPTQGHGHGDVGGDAAPAFVVAAPLFALALCLSHWRRARRALRASRIRREGSHAR